MRIVSCTYFFLFFLKGELKVLNLEKMILMKEKKILKVQKGM